MPLYQTQKMMSATAAHSVKHAKRKNGDFGRTYRHWRIDNKIYKSDEKFFEALKDFSTKVIPIRL
jgi:hypothetical protein